MQMLIKEELEKVLWSLPAVTISVIASPNLMTQNLVEEESGFMKRKAVIATEGQDLAQEPLPDLHAAGQGLDHNPEVVQDLHLLREHQDLVPDLALTPEHQ